MQTQNITKTGALINHCKSQIPYDAKLSLDLYANDKVKKLGLGTKAFKFKFPFYQTDQRKRSFRKIGELMKAKLKKEMPYIDAAKIELMDLAMPSSGFIYLRLDRRKVLHYFNDNQAVLERYIRRLTRAINTNMLPINIRMGPGTYTSLNEDGSNYWRTTEERRAHTHDVFEIRISLVGVTADQGYYLLHHFEDLYKVVVTLHKFICVDNHYDTEGNRLPFPPTEVSDSDMGRLVISKE